MRQDDRERPASSTDPVAPPHALDQLQANWQVQERPFVSTTPIVGPLVARLREIWNSVSTKWYVRRLLEQQNLFNRLVADQLVEHDRRTAEHDLILPEHDQRLIAQDRDLVALTRELADVRAHVHQLERRLEQLERSE